ncbi:MAG: hypothetical protein ACM3SS_17755 [Rhodospirillaceae bacterium]
MKTKTLMATAVAGMVTLPFAAGAHDDFRARTPLSVNEAGDARVQPNDDRFARNERAFEHERNWEVRTPLSIPEAGAPDGARQLAMQDRFGEPSGYSRGTVLRPAPASESSASHDTWLPERSSAAPQSERESLALADRGIYSEYYLVGVPAAETTDYYVVELEPAQNSSGEVIFMPRQ